MSVNQTNAEKAVAAWGDGMPDWVGVLARECDRLGQGKVASALGKSGGYVSRVVRCCYAGDYTEAEQLVRATFSAERVICPRYGSMALKTCITNRRRVKPVNWLHVEFARACPTCPNNTDRTPEEDA